MEYKILTHRHAHGLANLVKDAIAEGWTPKGSHQAVETHRQNRFAGTQHKDTKIEIEYSQTITK
jgi:hypothetical protein